MSGRSTQYTSGADWLVGSDFTLDPGRQIDWANVSSAYLDAVINRKVIPSGTAMGEQIDLDASGVGMISPRVDGTNPAIGLLLSDAIENDISAALTGYGLVRGGQAYEALLPDAGGSPRTLAGDVKAELQAAGTGWLFHVFQDVRS